MLIDDDEDVRAVSRNLQRARGKWGRISKILSREGTDSKTMASFYKAIVQSVLLYGAESWAITKSVEKKLRSFHRRCARYITRRHIRQNEDESWTCPASDSVLEEAGLWTVQEYIRRRRETVMNYANKTTIY